MTIEQITTILNWLLSVAFPLLVGLVTTRETNPLAKAILLATIAFASGLIGQLIAALVTGITFSLADALLTGAGAWLLAVTSHKELWTRTNIINALQQVGYHPKLAPAPKHSA